MCAAMQNPVQTMSSLEVALAVWRRRKWLALTTLAAVLSATVAIAKSLPNIFESTARVLVEYHQIPSGFTVPWATDDLETRLRTISEQIMSRARLYDLITRLNLYPELQEHATPEAIAARMRRDIAIQFNGVQQPSGLGTTVAFSLSYRAGDPDTAAQVTNALAALYVEENTRMRAQQTTETTQFLQVQLDEAKRQLDDQERKISEYKERHVGELPEQQVANLAALERLNTQLHVIMDQRDALAKGLGLSSAAAETPSSRLAKLRQELATLRIRYTDEHPNVLRIRQEIADLQRQPAADESGSAAGADSAARQQGAAPTAVDVEFTTLRSEEQALRRAIATYEQRIEAAPLREQELQQLSRDEAGAKDLYQSLLQRYQGAQVAERMEQSMGAQFRVLDPAIASRQPVGPHRVRLLLTGLMMGMGAAAGVALLAEVVDTSFHTVDEVRAFTSVPVLASIPSIVTKREARLRRRRSGVAVVAVALGMAAVFGASSYLAHSNALPLGLFAGGHL